MTHPTKYSVRPAGRKDLDRVDIAKAVKGYRRSAPIVGDAMDEPQLVPFSWDQPVNGFQLRVSGTVSPWANATVVVVRSGANAKTAHTYVEKAAEELPRDLREALLRGIGMLDVPVGPADTDDLFE